MSLFPLRPLSLVVHSSLEIFPTGFTCASSQHEVINVKQHQHLQLRSLLYFLDELPNTRICLALYQTHFFYSVIHRFDPFFRCFAQSRGFASCDSQCDSKLVYWNRVPVCLLLPWCAATCRKQCFARRVGVGVCRFEQLVFQVSSLKAHFFREMFPGHDPANAHQLIVTDFLVSFHRGSITSFCRHCRVSFCFACSNCRGSSWERFFTLTSTFLFLGWPATNSVGSQMLKKTGRDSCSEDFAGCLYTFRTGFSSVSDNTASPSDARDYSMNSAASPIFS